MTLPTTSSLREEVYKLTDSFLTEAKDQNGNERSLERLNQDRHLFVENVLSLREAELKEIAEWAESMKHELGQEEFNEDTDNEWRKDGYNQALLDLITHIKTLI